MRKIIFKAAIALWASMVLAAASAQTPIVTHEWKTATSGTYTYRYVTNDPMGVRFYTLSNGLTVALSPNHQAPRIAVRIAVRTGSNNDPKDHTGLAHYLEHLLFKGTNQFGSLDWTKEQPLLDQIEGLYEQYNHTTDSSRRTFIYHQIDSVSGVAAHYAIAGEYTHMMTALGSQGTNAHTSVEETVYQEDIPSNAIEPFLKIQAERFRYPVFRLFHTELEAVYEEKNRGLDNDASKMQEAMLSALFPKHNYGQQTTIGTIPHLKNPSLKAIRAYYNEYYVPGNMGIILAGDFDPDQLIVRIDQAFGSMQVKPVDTYKGPVEKPMDTVVSREVWGPTRESLRLAYRTAPSGTRDAMLTDLLGTILSNGKAGLLDVNLNRPHLVQQSGADLWQFKDYGALMVDAVPKQDQSLDQVKALVLEQINKLKKGDFDSTLIQASVANEKFNLIQGLDDNANRVESICDQFIKNKGQSWDRNTSYLEEMGKVSKAELVQFARSIFKDKDYAIIYKRKGVDNQIQKVTKPPITPVQTNSNDHSPFTENILHTALPPIAPQWVDYSKELQHGKTGIADLLYVPNMDNDLFRLTYTWDRGILESAYLQPALQYLQYLGTHDQSAADVSARFYNLACNYSVNVGSRETTITLTGLQEHFTEAVHLLQDLMTHCQTDSIAWIGFRQSVFKSRADALQNKRMLSRGLINYSLYGSHNPANSVLTDNQWKELSESTLVSLLHGLFDQQHLVTYYGPQSMKDLSASLDTLHPVVNHWSPSQPALHLAPIQLKKPQVLFTPYDAVQSDIFWAGPIAPYQKDKEALVNLFNAYFGGGMGSVVFRTIRESKALAYSTYAVCMAPVYSDDPYYLNAYVGCQADKFREGVLSMDTLLNQSLPLSEGAFENARKNLIKDLQTQRIKGTAIIDTYLDNRKKGWETDPRQSLYASYQQLQLKDLETYHKEMLENRVFTLSIIGSPARLSTKNLSLFGTVQTLTPEMLLGYDRSSQ